MQVLDIDNGMSSPAISCSTRQNRTCIHRVRHRYTATWRHMSSSNEGRIEVELLTRRSLLAFRSLHRVRAGLLDQRCTRRIRLGCLGGRRHDQRHHRRGRRSLCRGARCRGAWLERCANRRPSRARRGGGKRACLRRRHLDDRGPARGGMLRRTVQHLHARGMCGGVSEWSVCLPLSWCGVPHQRRGDCRSHADSAPGLPGWCSRWHGLDSDGLSRWSIRCAVATR